MKPGRELKTVVIIQARMSSSRLPGKVLFRPVDTTMLNILVDRLRKVRQASSVVVATSVDASDDPVEQECKHIGVDCFRGDLDDVMGRFYHAAESHSADIVVRITADCPLIDPQIVDYAIETFKSASPAYELVTNRLPLSFPDGMDVDVFSFQSLRDAFLMAKRRHQREHVIPYFFDEGKNILNFECRERHFLKIRLTLDYIEDFNVIKSVYKALGCDLVLADIIRLHESDGGIFHENQRYIPDNYYDAYDNVGPLLRRVCVPHLPFANGDARAQG